MADFRFGSMVIEDHGRGPAVVMVHGLGGTSNSFQSLMPALDGYRVLRPDLPGAGRSACRPGRTGLTALASAVSDAMRALEIHRAHFVGHSMGTLVCQILAAQQPQLVASLTLFGALLEPSPAARDALRERAANAREHGLADIAEAISTGSTAKSSRSGNPVIEAFVRESVLRHNPSDYATHCEWLSEAKAALHDKIECSTMLIAAENDNVAPVSMSQELKKKIDMARLEVIPKVGHWMIIEAARECSAYLRAHLDEMTA